jgi:hypothetical protein
MPETAKELRQKPEVWQELARATNEKSREKVKAEPKDKFWFVTHALLLIGCAVLYYLIGSQLIPLLQAEADISRRILRGFALIVIILGGAKAVIVYAIGRIEDAVTRFTLQRIQYLVCRGARRNYSDFRDFRELVCRARRAGCRLTHRRIGRANTDEKFYRLDLHSCPASFSCR